MRKVLLLAPALLAGCSTAATPEESAAAPATAAPAAETGSACRSGDYSSFKGRTLTADVRSELQQASGAQVVRVVEPGMMVTMDYQENRITVQVDEQNRITSANCG